MSNMHSKDDYIPGKIPYFGTPTDVILPFKHEWGEMTEAEIMNYLRVRSVLNGHTGGVLVCHGPTLEFVRNFGARAEEILKRHRIAFTVREDKDLPEDGGPHWWRIITIDHPESVEPIDSVVQ